ncbi:MAG: hypothetical protein U9O94_10510 [Nanoarchaeota archaeon]|nr:hypothetical protein [Nanoarchaeota archaeon]
MKKTNKNIFLIITLVLLIFIPITYSFSGSKIGSDTYVETNSPSKLGSKTLNNAQANIVNTLCEADRYTDRYLFPGSEVDAPGICKTCDGNGNVGNINGADPHSECAGISCSSYYYGWVSNTCYRRKDVSASEHICVSGACQTSSVCPSQPQGSSSGVSRTTCKTPSGCSGTTAPSLGNVAAGQDTYGDCSGSCRACNGAGACAPFDTQWGQGAAYGCSGSDRRCYSGSCVQCSGWFNSNQCWYAGGLGEGCGIACSNGCYPYRTAVNGCSICDHFFDPDTEFGTCQYISNWNGLDPLFNPTNWYSGGKHYSSCIDTPGIGGCARLSIAHSICSCNT